MINKRYELGTILWEPNFDYLPREWDICLPQNLLSHYVEVPLWHGNSTHKHIQILPCPCQRSCRKNINKKETVNFKGSSKSIRIKIAKATFLLQWMLLGKIKSKHNIECRQKSVYVKLYKIFTGGCCLRFTKLYSLLCRKQTAWQNTWQEMAA